jgi:hypothetical protein
MANPAYIDGRKYVYYENSKPKVRNTEHAIVSSSDCKTGARPIAWFLHMEYVSLFLF